MSTSVTRSSAEKKISSWVRPGVLEVRANPLRLASALIRLDLPTLERPAKANSKPFITGSEAGVAAAAAKRHSPANSLRPAPTSVLVTASVGIGGRPYGQAGPLTPVLLFFLNKFLMPRHTSLRLSHNSILAPFRRMMTDCWITD